MIELTNVYRCICEKCKSEWNAKDTTIPATCAKCRSTKWNTQDEPRNNLVDQVKSLNTAKRLELFEHFELCCGMNRGACICEAETPKPYQTIQPEKKTILEALQAKIDAIETGGIQETEPAEWKFTKDAPDYADNGNVYRKQGRMLGSGKFEYRTVKVDPDDPNIEL